MVENTEINVVKVVGLVKELMKEFKQEIPGEIFNQGEYELLLSLLEDELKNAPTFEEFVTN